MTTMKCQWYKAYKNTDVNLSEGSIKFMDGAGLDH